MKSFGLLALLIISSVCAVQGFGDLLKKWPLQKHKDNGKFDRMHLLKVSILFRVLFKLSVKVVTIHDSGASEPNHHKPVFVDRCGSHEVWYSCLPTCPITCDNLYKQCDPKGDGRCLKGCDCARGYARRSGKGPCIPISHCPGKNKS